MRLSLIALAAENQVVLHEKKWLGNREAYNTYLSDLTKGQVVVMSERAWLLEQDVYAGAKIIVVSDHSEFQIEIYPVVTRWEDALALAGNVAEVFCVGSEIMTEKLWKEADRLYLTLVHKDVDGNNMLPFICGKEWCEVSRSLVWGGDEEYSNYSNIVYQRENLSLAISVVISTCNQPEWLEKTLWGYEAQTIRDFELIIADDGSRRETYDMLQKVIPQLSYSVKHIWHEDKGFRKCDILNKGILACVTDYLLFSDGDCVPRKDFVATHIKYRQPGRCWSGGYHKLGMELSRMITGEDILTGKCFDIKWLKERGMVSSFKNNKFTSFGFKEWLLNTFTPTKPTWNGHNASGWLSDILATNGFDERMQYGGQDREFGERLENNGIHGKQIRYSAVCIHLDHSRGYKTPESVQKNLKIRKTTRQDKIKVSAYGIVKL